MRRKLLSILLVLCMALALLPTSALAAEEGDAVGRWIEAGVLKAEDAAQSDAAMTRGELARLLVNLMGYTETAPAETFSDVSAADEYAPYILKLAAAGLLKGSDGKANPKETVAWQEAAKLICTALGIAQESDGAEKVLAALVERGAADAGKTEPAKEISLSAAAGMLDQLIAHYVTKDAEITGEVKGLVVVAAKAKVAVKDAVLTEKLIVAPGAKDAKVDLTGATTVPDVVVAASDAKVTVQSGAVVITITVKGGNASVDVSGKVDNLKAAGDNAKIVMSGAATVQNMIVSAPNGTVTVASDASVSNITVEAGADRAKVTISGSAGTVNLIGSKATLTAKDNAKVDHVSSSGDDNSIIARDKAEIKDVVTSGDGSTTVSGNGTVGTVTATGTNKTDVTTPGTTVENKGDGKVTAGGKPVAPGETATTPAKPTPSGNNGSGASAGNATCCNGNNATDQGKDDNTSDPETPIPGQDPCEGQDSSDTGSGTNTGGDNGIGADNKDTTACDGPDATDTGSDSAAA